MSNIIPEREIKASFTNPRAGSSRAGTLIY